MKKIFVMFLVFALSITMFGCHRENDTPKVNKDQTQLYVFNYDGGVGQEWLESAIEKFEEIYVENYLRMKNKFSRWFSHLFASQIVHCFLQLSKLCKHKSFISKQSLKYCKIIHHCKSIQYLIERH